jgi:hypothetical protein
MPYGYFESIGTQETLPWLPVGLVTFSPCLWRLKSRKVLTLYYSLFSFSCFYLRVFEIFYKERQSSSDGVCYLTKGFLMSLNFLFYGLYVELWVG